MERVERFRRLPLGALKILLGDSQRMLSNASRGEVGEIQQFLEDGAGESLIGSALD